MTSPNERESLRRAVERLDTEVSRFLPYCRTDLRLVLDTNTSQEAEIARLKAHVRGLLMLPQVTDRAARYTIEESALGAVEVRVAEG